MKKHIILGCLGLSLIIILHEFGTFDALLLFLLVGAVPGTHFNLSPLLMLGVFAIISGILVAYANRPLGRHQSLPKQTITRRRYGRV